MKKFIIGFFRPCDFITMTSTALAIAALFCSVNARFSLAVLLLAICGICDAYDGKVARMRKNTKEETEYGIQMDSLNDVVAFGVVPAVITSSIVGGSLIVKIICVFYVLCGVIRLAYFNMLEATEDKKKKKKGYIGVPITTIAIIYPIPYLICRLNNLQGAEIALPVTLLIMGLLFIIRIRIPKIDFPNIFAKIFNKYIVNFVYFPVLVIFGMNLFFNLTVRGRSFETVIYTLTAFKYIFLFIFLYLFVVALHFILSSIFNSFKTSKIIIGIGCVALAVINDIKYKILALPIFLSDASYLNPDNMEMMGTSTSTYGSWIIEVIVKGVVFFLLFLLLVFVIKKTDIKFKKVKNRLLCLVVSIVVLVASILFINNDSKFAVNHIFKTNADEIKVMTAAEVYMKYGMTGGIILEDIQKDVLKGDSYSKEIISKIINNQKGSNDEKWGEPNVIFMLSEAFFDLDNVKEITFNKDTKEFFNSLEDKKNADTFNIITPVFGGASVNCEFEVLTGTNLINLWNKGYIPYNGYYLTGESKKAPNIIKELNNNDYKTIYYTPWGSTSFNSEKVYSNFGVDEKDYNVLKDERYVKGYYLSEDKYIDSVLKKLKENKDNNTFIMTASAENHYPFEYDKFKKYDVNIKNTTLDKDFAKKVQSYAQGQYDQDKGLEKLYNSIQEIEEPTVVLYFGDHLPSIQDDNGKQALFETSYFKTGNPDLNEFREHTTKGAIFANYDIDLEDFDYINANYLGSYILNHLNLNTSNYFKYVENIRSIIPSFYGNNIYKNGKLINIKDTDKNIRSKFQELKDAEYYMFYEN